MLANVCTLDSQVEVNVKFSLLLSALVLKSRPPALFESGGILDSIRIMFSVLHSIDYNLTSGINTSSKRGLWWWTLGEALGTLFLRFLVS